LSLLGEGISQVVRLAGEGLQLADEILASAFGFHGPILSWVLNTLHSKVLIRIGKDLALQGPHHGRKASSSREEHPPRGAAEVAAVCRAVPAQEVDDRPVA